MPLLQLDRVDQAVLAHGVALGKHRDHLHVLVEAVQAFVERLGHRLRQRVVGIVGVGGRERARRPRRRRPWRRGPASPRQSTPSSERSEDNCDAKQAVSCDTSGLLRRWADRGRAGDAVNTRRRCDAWRRSDPVRPARAAARPARRPRRGSGLGTSSDDSSVFRAPSRRVGNGHRGHELLRVGMPRLFEDRAPRPDFHDLAQVHHGHAMADAFDHGHVVGDEQVGKPELGLQVEQQVDDLRPDRYVERRRPPRRR